MKQKLSVLLIGRKNHLMWFLPQMLARAGFCVDIIASSRVMKYSRFVRNYEFVRKHDCIASIAQKRIQKNYDWVIVCEDSVLLEILNSDLSQQDKLKLLPIKEPENFKHLYSKIALSKLFAENGIGTPAFCVASSKADALEQAERLKYPLLVKLDSCGGGNGVFECRHKGDLLRIKDKIFEKPVLLQQKIEGVERDLSAIYLDGKLVHFTDSRLDKVCFNKFGPSTLRTYYPIHALQKEIFDELRHIGEVLGANTFVSLTCIESRGRRFYFEADMRPNVWVDMGRFVGEDPSCRIKAWFLERKILSYPVSTQKEFSSSIRIPYFLRMGFLELLSNRYQVWHFVPRKDPLLVLCLVGLHLLSYFTIHKLAEIVKKILPESYHEPIRQKKHAVESLLARI